MATKVHSYNQQVASVVPLPVGTEKTSVMSVLLVLICKLTHLFWIDRATFHDKTSFEFVTV
jgi:hypothetical protein